jgi:phosphate starvation-inducible PhoH-like protein
LARKKIIKETPRDKEIVPSLKMLFAPKNEEQKNMIKVIAENHIIFVKGTAGTGKSFVSIACALNELVLKRCDKVIFTRPIIPASGDDQIGFLKGSLLEKVSDYFAPMFSILSQMISIEDLRHLTKDNGNEAKIKILPLAFMRGHTFNSTIVVADEFQNSTIEQTRLLVTRLGSNSKIIICGDSDQSDVYGRNGLEHAWEVLKDIKGIGFVTLSEQSIVRHPLIREIETRYNNYRKLKAKN